MSLPAYWVANRRKDEDNHGKKRAARQRRAPGANSLERKGRSETMNDDERRWRGHTLRAGGTRRARKRDSRTEGNMRREMRERDGLERRKMRIKRNISSVLRHGELVFIYRREFFMKFFLFLNIFNCEQRNWRERQIEFICSFARNILFFHYMLGMCVRASDAIAHEYYYNYYVVLYEFINNEGSLYENIRGRKI